MASTSITSLPVEILNKELMAKFPASDWVNMRTSAKMFQGEDLETVRKRFTVYLAFEKFHSIRHIRAHIDFLSGVFSTKEKAEEFIRDYEYGDVVHPLILPYDLDMNYGTKYVYILMPNQGMFPILVTNNPQQWKMVKELIGNEYLSSLFNSLDIEDNTLEIDKVSNHD